MTKKQIHVKHKPDNYCVFVTEQMNNRVNTTYIQATDDKKRVSVEEQ